MKNLNLILIFILSSFFTKAQQALNTAGGVDSVNNFIVDWNFGELTLVEYSMVNNLLVTQGLIQPGRGQYFEPDAGISLGELKILPNPTSGILKVWVGFLVPGKLQFEFFDSKGSRILFEEKIYNSFDTYQFDLGKYASAAYPLKVSWTPLTGKMRKTNFTILKQ